MRKNPGIKTLLCVLLLGGVVGCSESTNVSDDMSGSSNTAVSPAGREARTESSPGERPIRIGEGGPRFDACQAVGKVAGLRSGDLDVRIAPFDSAKAKDSLSAGQMVYICTRSIDQQWFGIVYTDASPKAPATADGEAPNDLAVPPAMELGDCGVSSPVRSKRNYDGPCKSGWVESNFVKLVAG